MAKSNAKANAYGVPEWATWVPVLTRPQKTRPAWARRVGILLVVAVLLAAASAAALSLLQDDGPPHPEAWDAQVQELVDFVEAERGVRFEEPVFVDLLDDADFAAALRDDREDLTTAGDPSAAKLATYAAVGLVEGNVRARDLQGVRTVSGYYSYDDERIRVRGTDLTPALRSTLVRELTHALDDQRSGVGESLAKVAGDAEATEAILALTASEGRRVESLWRLELGTRQQTALAEADAEADAAAAPALDTLPAVIGAEVTAPRVLAEAALDLAVTTRGEPAVDQLLRAPPTTGEHLLDPWTLLSDRAVPIGTSPPALTAREKEVGHGTFGAVSWLVLLAARISPADALAAADGWGGDAYVTFTRDGASCLRIDYRGDTGPDVNQMRQALAAWSSSAPAGSTRVRRAGALLTFESCSVPVTGATAPPVGATGPQDALALATRRTSVSATLVVKGWLSAQARCAADLMVRSLTPQQLRKALTGPLDDRKLRKLTAPCEE